MTSPNRSVVVRLAMEPSSYVAGASKAAAATTALDREVAKVGTTSATSMEKAAASAGKAEGAFGKLNKVTSVLGVSFGGLAAVGGAVAAAMSVKSAGDFEQSLTKLATTAGESQKNLHMVGDGLLDMAGKVGISAGELAKGMYTVESGGFHGAAGLTVMKAAAQGAVQEQADLGKVTDAVTTILHDYHLKASDASTVTSQLVTAVSHGKTTFDELTGSLHSVTPLAAKMGISLADITGTLSAMTASGESADQATQNMANTLQHLAAPTSTMINELAQLGISTDDLATSLSTKGLAGTLQMVETAIVDHVDPATQRVLLPALNKSKSAAQDLQIMLGQMPPTLAKLSQGLMSGTTSFSDYRKAVQDLGGPSSAMGKQFLALFESSQGFNNVLKGGGPAAQVFTAAMQKAFGTTAALNVALQTTGENTASTNAAIKDIGKATGDASGNIKGWAEVQGNFNQQLHEAEAAAGALAIQFGQHLLPVLTGALGFVTHDVIPGIEHMGSAIGDAAHWFGELPGPVKEAALALGGLALANKIGVFSALASGASSFVGVLGRMKSGVGGAVTSMEGLRSAGAGLMNFFGGPVVLGIAGVTAAVAASSAELDDWAKGLEQGGKAAQIATQQLEDAHSRSLADAHSVGDAWGIVKGAFADGLAQIKGYSSAQDEATQKAKDWYNALSPTQRLAHDVSAAQNDLNTAIDDYGRGSGEAKFAAWKLNLALGDQQTAAANADIATRGLNGALSAQIGLQQQLSQAGLSLDQATLTSKQAIDQYKSSLKDANLTEDARAQALDGVSQSMFGVLDAAKQKADAETKGLPQSIITNQEIVRQRDALNQVVQQLGFVPPALQGMYDQLNGPTAKALQAAQTNVNTLGTAMTTVTTNDAPGMQKALNDLATAAGTTFPQAVTGAFLPAAQGAGAAAVITAGNVGTAASNVDGLVRSLLGVPAGTDTSNRALGGLNQWTGSAATVIGNLSSAISHIPGVQITADATQANDTINAFLQKVQSQGFVGAIWNINPVGGGNSSTPGFLQPLGVPRKATGGSIVGPGTGTSDSVLIAASNGEHMWTAREVAAAGGHGAVEALRRSVLASGGGRANGGPVLPRTMTYPVDAGPGLMELVKREAQNTLSAMAVPGPGGSVERWRPVVLRVLAELGIAASAANGVLHMIQAESGGNPNAINLTDSNARAGHPSQGLLQTIPTTFAAWAGPYRGLGITNPLASIYAGTNYALHTYGFGMLAAGGRKNAFGGYMGYKDGTDYVPSTGPAVLHQGEAVLTTKQAEAYRAGIRTREVSGSGSGFGLVAALREALSGVALGDVVGLANYGTIHTDPDELARRATQRSRRILSAAGVKV